MVQREARTCQIGNYASGVDQKDRPNSPWRWPVRLPIFGTMPIHVRVIVTYPADGSASEETFDLTFELPPSFASTPAGAHMRIVAPLERGFDTAFPVEGDDCPAEFSAEVVREVWVRAPRG